jgi:peptide/nickel transport system permease protein
MSGSILTGKGRRAGKPGPGSEALLRLLRNRGAVIGGILLTGLTLMAIFAWQLVPYDPFKPNAAVALRPPMPGHPFGTDNLGRDLLSRVILGSRWSLKVGVIAVVISTLIGVPLGLLSGYAGGAVDMVISRGIEVLMAFPNILLAMAIVAVLGPGVNNVMIAVGVSGMPRYVRVVRSAVLAERETAYVEAARVGGFSNPRVMFRHILPNVMAPVVVLGTLEVAGAILAASSLGYLGLGAQPPDPEWGALLAGARAFMRSAWWLTVFPGLFIMISVLSMNMLGDGLRDALDPRLRGEGS